VAIPSSSTRSYDALLTTTLSNWLVKNAVDNIATANAFLNAMITKPGGYVAEASLGDRASVPLRYALGTPDSYGDYDTLKNNPLDGLTRAFYSWRQASSPVMISGMEEAKNSGEHAVISLLDEKTDQVMIGMKEWFAKTILQGDGINGNSIETAFTSASNGSSFLDPIPLLVKKDPTTSTVIGNINQNTHSWWRNQLHSSASSNYAGFLKELSNLRLDCSKGPGGPPNFHQTDQNSFSYYESALRSQHRNPSYQRADIPFESIQFHGAPVYWDEFMPCVQDGDTTLEAAKGSWFMLNTQFLTVKYHASTNFVPTEFRTPTNQDAKVSHIQWKGALCVSNRRKQGIEFNIDTTPTS